MRQRAVNLGPHDLTVTPLPNGGYAVPFAARAAAVRTHDDRPARTVGRATPEDALSCRTLCGRLERTRVRSDARCRAQRRASVARPRLHAPRRRRDPLGERDRSRDPRARGAIRRHSVRPGIAAVFAAVDRFREAAPRALDVRPGSRVCARDATRYERAFAGDVIPARSAGRRLGRRRSRPQQQQRFDRLLATRRRALASTPPTPRSRGDTVAEDRLLLRPARPACRRA